MNTTQEAKGNGRSLVQFAPPRLPYHEAIEQRFGIDKSGWKALVEAVYPSAKSIDSVAMALSYCRARNLDPFKRPVHIVPMWDSRRNEYVETIWPGIAELRTTASRTGQYAGCDEAVFGEDIERTFTGRVKRGQNWEERSITVTFPEWCRITVYRLVGAHRVSFVGPKVYWLETYAKVGPSELPNEMWAKRPRGQLEKCAEAGALRKAFPEELGNTLSAEEMEGQRLHAEHGPIIDHEPAETDKPASPKQALDMFAEEPAADQAPEEPQEPQDGQTEAAAEREPGEDDLPSLDDYDGAIASWIKAMAGAPDEGEVRAYWEAMIQPHIEAGHVMPPDVDKLTRERNKAVAKLGAE